MKHYNAGKGDKPRPTNQQKYAENYDLIFGKKPAPPVRVPTPQNGQQDLTKKGEIK